MDDFIRRPTRPVMDIQPRRPIQPTTRPPAPVSRPSSPEPMPAPNPEPVSPLTPEYQPHSFTPPTASVEEPPVNAVPKAKAPILAIIVALMVSACLITLTIFAYAKNNKSETAVIDKDSLSETTDSKEIQDASKEIEDALNGLDDAADFNESDLLDDKLGL